MLWLARATRVLSRRWHSGRAVRLRRTGIALSAGVPPRSFALLSDRRRRRVPLGYITRRYLRRKRIRQEQRWPWVEIHAHMQLRRSIDCGLAGPPPSISLHLPLPARGAQHRARLPSSRPTTPLNYLSAGISARSQDCRARGGPGSRARGSGPRHVAVARRLNADAAERDQGVSAPICRSIESLRAPNPAASFVNSRLRLVRLGRICRLAGVLVLALLYVTCQLLPQAHSQFSTLGWIVFRLAACMTFSSSAAPARCQGPWCWARCSTCFSKEYMDPVRALRWTSTLYLRRGSSTHQMPSLVLIEFPVGRALVAGCDGARSFCAGFRARRSDDDMTAHASPSFAASLGVAAEASGCLS